MLRLLLLAGTFAAHAFAGQLEEGSIAFVREKQRQAIILISPTASEAIRDSAKELQNYIKKSTGVELPIQSNGEGGINAIHIGETPYVKSKELTVTELDRDGFILRGFSDGNYIIVGASDLGTSFGVYEFLERYVGVRWLMPGEMGEVVPNLDDLIVTTNEIRQEPVFLSRDFYRSNSGEENLWAKRNRIHRRVEEGHNMTTLFPVEEFGSLHPDFYPLVDGKRQIPGNRIAQPKNIRELRNHRNWQPNFSAPGIVEAAANKIDQYFQENPEAISFKLGLNDGNDNFDESPESMKRRSGKKNSGGYLDASDDYFLWANAVAEKVLEKHPDKWFGTLAYRALFDPPAHAGVHERLVPYITYDRLRWADPKLKAFDQNLSLKWLAAAKNIGWYDYSYGMQYWVPRVYPHLMGEYLSWAAEHRIRFYYGEQSPNWGEGPKTWLLTKLLWNPRQDVDLLLTEWYEQAAGKEAAPKLREYFEIWETFWTKRAPTFKRWWSGKSPYLTFANRAYLQEVSAEEIMRSDELLDDAYSLAGTPEQKARVANLREMWKTWYKPNIVLNQVQERLGYVPQTENDALRALDESEKALVMADEFKKTTTIWQTDPKYRSNPFYENFSRRFSIRRPAPPDYPNSAFLLWQLEPWVAKSSKIRERLDEMLKSDAPVVRDNVRALLASVDNKGISVVKNPSFEQGMEFWDLLVDTQPFPSDYPFPDDLSAEVKTFEISERKGKTASRFLEVSANRVPGTTDVLYPVRVMQSVPYDSGSYFATVSYSLAPGSRKMSASDLSIQVLDENGSVLPEIALSPIAINPIAGKWGRGVGIFSLPSNPKAKSLQVVLKLGMLDVNYDYDPKLKVYIDNLNLVKLIDDTATQ